MTVFSRERRADAPRRPTPPDDENDRFVVSAPPFDAPTTIAGAPLDAETVVVDSPPFVEYVVVERLDPNRLEIAPSFVLFQNDATLTSEPAPVVAPAPTVVSFPFPSPTFAVSPTKPPLEEPDSRPEPDVDVAPTRKAPVPAAAPRSDSPRSDSPRAKPRRLDPRPKPPRVSPSAAKPVALPSKADRLDETLKTAAFLASNAKPNLARLAVDLKRDVAASPAFFAKLRVVAEPVVAAKKLDFLREPSALEQAKKEAPGWASSLFVHLLLIALLALLASNATQRDPFELISQPGLNDDFVLDDVFDPETAFEPTDDVRFETTNSIPVDSEVVADVPEISAFDEPTSAPLSLLDDPLAVESVAARSDADVLGTLNGDELSGRGANKAAALATGGGSEGSEKSVALALAWLAEHQLEDGSWSFQFARCPQCAGACSHSGTKDAPFAATAMALLPFLAAGHTSTQGKYKKVVAKGIRRLLENAKSTDDGLDLRDADVNAAMYAHGIATIALCEAYAMQDDREKSRNPRLAYAAQNAIRFIEYYQDPYGGGWRYSPQQAGDTSVVGWQTMALKSALLGGLTVDASTARLALKFLRETAAFDGESRYGYTDTNQSTGATTSAGLLCRLYLDWRTDNPAALAGADWILGQGPDLRNPYYNYYATQFLHHLGGERWSRWNSAIRDKLIATQSLDGHERGSWYPTNADGHCQTGGRLYATSLNCMILEVYYRHMPLYRQLDDSSRFPLELPADVDAEK